MSRQLVIASLVCIIAVAGTARAEEQTSDCLTVVRVYFADRAQLAEIASWTEPWEVDHERGWAVVGVSEQGLTRLLTSGFQIEVDVKLTAAICAPRLPLEGQRAGIPGYPCYRTVEETFLSAQAIAAAHPDLAEWIDVGDSWEKSSFLGGYDMMVLKLTNSAVQGTPTGDVPPHGKPKLYVTSAIHAREYTTAELMIRFAEYLIDGHGVDADATWILDEHEVHLQLHTNPDGRKKAETGLLWRKNTNQDYCGATSNDRGADLNRNFSYQWGCCGGSSGYECDETYRGPSPASEPETQTVESYSQAIFPDQRDSGAAPPDATGLYIDVHASGELVLWPWGYTSTPAPNGTALQTLGRKLAFFNGHYPEQAIGLYPTDGTTDDFVYGDLGVAAYTFELGTWFFEDCSYFESSILPGNMDALVYGAKVARTPYLTASGPNVTAIGLDGATVVPPGTPISLSAVLSDTQFSNANGAEPTQNIAAAEYTLDQPPWQDPAPVAHAMTAVDGSFNSTVEAVEGTVDTAALGEGRHTVFVHGRDAGDSWGAVSAVFFWVLDPANAARIEGTVLDANDHSPLAATVSTGPFSTTTDPGDGSYSLMVPEGTYAVTASADGHAPITVDGVGATSGNVTVQDFLLPPYFDILADDVEGGNLGWSADPPWAITTEAANSPTHSWTDSPGGDYANNADVSLTSPPLDLAWITGVTLEFSHIYDLEEDYDYGRVEYSTDGGATWAAAVSFSGTQTSSWVQESIDLPGLNGAANARFRFRVDADWGITEDGWHVDDIVLRGALVPPAGVLFWDGFESGNASAWSAAVGN